MDTKEFYGWMQYYNLEPWGNIVDGYRNASLAANITNMGLLGADPKAYKKHHCKLEDFLIGVDKEKIEKNKRSVNEPMSLEKSKELLSFFEVLSKSRKSKK